MRPIIQYRIRALSQTHQYLRFKQTNRLYLYSIRPTGLFTPPLRRTTPPVHHLVTSQASYSPYIIVFLVACSGAAAYEYYANRSPLPEVSPAPPPTIEEFPILQDERHPAYEEMPVPEGYIGNLTPQQEVKLREFWTALLRAFAVVDPEKGNGSIEQPPTAIPAHVQTATPEKKKKKKSGLFSRGRHDDDDGASTADEDDKYGQTAELQHILKTQSPEVLRITFWEMVKGDHPDSLLLRFLRARKWDVDKALAMLISTMDWRKAQMHVDEDIMMKGEAGALADSQGSDSSVKKDGHDFIAQFRMGKSFLHGTDASGRPITWVRVRLHKGGEQTEKSLERYTVYLIETARLLLRPPVETACIVFDMTNFTLANMDYSPVKFMIKVFEANYPESLGAVLVHKAPWVFQGVWKIIRGWLDPVVAAKVHFTNNAEDMEAFIPKKQMIKEIGGEEDWDYQYIECVNGENDAMKDTATKSSLQEQRTKLVLDYQDRTFKWIRCQDDEVQGIKSGRDVLAKQLGENYWQLDPYVRARSLYDRVGMIDKTGKINFYPKHTLKAENVDGTPPKVSTAVHADDDVD